jgi:hypothetical protein
LNAAIWKVAVAADNLPEVCVGNGTSWLTEIGQVEYVINLSAKLKFDAVMDRKVSE